MITSPIEAAASCPVKLCLPILLQTTLNVFSLFSHLEKLMAIQELQTLSSHHYRIMDYMLAGWKLTEIAKAMNYHWIRIIEIVENYRLQS